MMNIFHQQQKIYSKDPFLISSLCAVKVIYFSTETFGNCCSQGTGIKKKCAAEGKMLTHRTHKAVSLLKYSSYMSINKGVGGRCKYQHRRRSYLGSQDKQRTVV